LRIRHPEPSGSRWATPPSLIQQRPGHPLAAAISVTPQHVSQLERRGIIEKSGYGRYAVSEIAKVVAFREGSPRSETPATPELTLERTLLVRAQREKAELELAVRRGDMVSRADEEAKAIEVAVNIRNRLLAVAERCSHRLGLKRDVTLALDEEIRTALTELSQMGAQQ
jgi:phage terminase Nu1 subunit (DNA packaging protein)